MQARRDIDEAITLVGSRYDSSTALFPFSCVASEREIAQLYTTGERLASDGMGALHLGMKRGGLGFQRIVAIKKFNRHVAQDARFKEEIRRTSRLTHPNIAQTLDIVEAQGGLELILELVDGVTLHELMLDAARAGYFLPTAVAAGVVCQALHGLHAAHEATDDAGGPLHIVHREVSPLNLMIGKEGLVKVLDFGLAKASSDTHDTPTGEVSDKVAYLAPEQVALAAVDRRTDVFAAGALLWEALTGEPLFRARGTPAATAVMNVLELEIRKPSELRRGLSSRVDWVVMRALARDPARRFASARDFALALEAAVPVASASEIARVLGELCAARIEKNAEMLRRFRQTSDGADWLRPDVSRTIPELSEVTLPLSATLAAEPERPTSYVRGASSGEAPRAKPASAWYTGVALAASLLVGWFVAPFELGADSAEPARPASVPPEPAREPEPMPAATPPSELASLAAPALLAPPSQALETAETSPSVRAPAEPKANAKAARSARTRPAASKKKRIPPVDPCSPPTFTDAEGIRHFKRECL
jgi:eukaryotic-like serine/threonine-protein kinase